MIEHLAKVNINNKHGDKQRINDKDKAKDNKKLLVEKMKEKRK